MRSCPACAAPVEIPPDVVVVVCSYCDQTLLVERGVLTDSGVAGGLLGIASPLTPGATGTLRGMPFWVRGRARFAWVQGAVTSFDPKDAEGEYEEWLLEVDGTPVWLEQDEGEWLTRARETIRDPLPPASAMRPGTTVVLEGKPWLVTERGAARVLGVQGVLDLRVLPGDVFQYFDAVSEGRAFSVERIGSSAWLLAGGPLDPSELVVS